MKWLFTDFDGTLRNSRDEKNLITKIDMDFMMKWQKNGNKIIIATGRPFEHISDHLKENYPNFIPDYYLTNAGAAIYDNNSNELFAKYLPTNLTNEIISFVENNRSEIFSLVYSFKGEENFFYHDHWEEEMSKTFMGMRPQNKPFNYIKDKEMICFKMSCKTSTWNMLMKNLKNKRISFSYVSNNLKEITFNEIHNAEVSKGNAIKEMAKIFNIDKKDIIVAGDDNNDLSMFKEFFENSYMVIQEHNVNIRDKAKYVINKLSDIKMD
ncbi:hypothetical protein MENTO_v1c07220 [Mesoplasma entomophilum]|uniref:Haloacid dehalogenase n=1 Tax=Mesoplasma entomophilum TaxID=2149 RepID=A0A3S5Y0R3_9MOLU|nr:Cof-type HAD-IIB family hydrolase [Mesoplasma entomophilum]ATQ35850.1 hypothetical protein CS528_03765 [Mesoplasma entomophilum]ATZ19822.1 hypothetical protein MENTO_v1c07220 [Mesoplasma entomophilum]